MFSFISMPKREKGQGLFIYMLFLLFLVTVVIVVMRVVQPNSDGIVMGNFEADYRYWNNPANGCGTNYNYGTNAGCDVILDRIQACLDGSTGSYCDDYFARSP